MTSSARRRDNATLAAVTAFTKIRQQVRAAATSVAVQELLDLEDDMSGQMVTALTPGSRGTWSHGQTTSSLRGPICFETRIFSIPPPEQRSCFDDASVFLMYVFFLTLVRRVIEEGWFPTAEVDVVGRQCIPVTLKVSNLTQ